MTSHIESLTCLQMGAYLLMEMSKTKTDPSCVSTAKMVLECWDQDTSETCNSATSNSIEFVKRDSPDILLSNLALAP